MAKIKVFHDNVQEKMQRWRREHKRKCYNVPRRKFSPRQLAKAVSRQCPDCCAKDVQEKNAKMAKSPQEEMLHCSRTDCYKYLPRRKFSHRQLAKGVSRQCPDCCAKDVQEKNAKMSKRAQEEMLQCSRTDCYKYLPRRKYSRTQLAKGV